MGRPEWMEEFRSTCEAEGVEGFVEGVGQELLNRGNRPLPTRQAKYRKGMEQTQYLGYDGGKTGWCRER